MADRAKSDKVDLNTASREELVAVPGIGDAGADAIVKYRQEHGRFGAVDDLVNVAGFGAATLESVKAHVTAGRGGGSGKREDDRGAAAEKPAEVARKAGEAGAEAVQRTGQSAAEGAQRVARETTGAARATAETGAEATRQAGETVAGGYEQLFALSQGGMEGVARAGQLVFAGTSELGRVWMSYWNEQFNDGVETMRALAACRTWQEALDIQSEFTRTSFERAWSQATRSAELTAEMMNGGLRPLQAAAASNVAAFPRQVA